MSKIYFTSYSSTLDGSDDGLKARQTLLNKSAVTVSNADEEIAWTREDLLDSDFFKQNKKIFDQPRGAGYWAWKPYIILQTLNRLSSEDWLIYSDAGKPYRRNDPTRCGSANIGNVMNVSFDALINYAKNNNGFTPGIWIPHYGIAKQWTKRDCFVGMGCDQPKYHNSSHLQAGYSCWSNSTASIEFLTEWLNFCQVEAIVSDNANIYGKPNFDEFRDHRHDQSILTNLVIKNNIKLFNAPTESLNGSRDFNFIIRHMALKSSLLKKTQELDILFEPNSLLPIFLKQVVQLWLLPEIKAGVKINILQNSKLEIWQQAFPDSVITSHRSETNKQLIKEEFTAVFANNCKQTDKLEEILTTSYESLLPGGILFMGPYKGKKVEQGKLNASFDELIQWIFINQCFPPNLSNKKNQLPNAITLGNAHNPFVINQGPDDNFIILRKPHMSLSLL